MLLPVSAARIRTLQPYVKAEHRWALDELEHWADAAPSQNFRSRRVRRDRRLRAAESLTLRHQAAQPLLHLRRRRAPTSTRRPSRTCARPSSGCAKCSDPSSAQRNGAKLGTSSSRPKASLPNRPERFWLQRCAGAIQWTLCRYRHKRRAFLAQRRGRGGAVEHKCATRAGGLKTCWTKPQGTAAPQLWEL